MCVNKSNLRVVGSFCFHFMYLWIQANIYLCLKIILANGMTNGCFNGNEHFSAYLHDTLNFSRSLEILDFIIIIGKFSEATMKRTIILIKITICWWRFIGHHFENAAFQMLRQINKVMNGNQNVCMVNAIYL